MSDGVFRIIIIVFGLIWTTGFLLALVMLFYLYQKMSVLQASTNETVNEIKKVVAESREVIKPVLHIKAIIDAIHSGVGIVGKISEMCGREQGGDKTDTANKGHH